MSTDIDTLVRQIEELKAMEDEAYRLYGSILPDIADAQDRRAVELIQADEQKHSKMAEKIISIIKS